jgi:hypothetical protein
LQNPTSHYPAPFTSQILQFAAQAVQVNVEVKPNPSLHSPVSHLPEPFVMQDPAVQFVSQVTHAPLTKAYPVIQD